MVREIENGTVRLATKDRIALYAVIVTVVIAGITGMLNAGSRLKSVEKDTIKNDVAIKEIRFAQKEMQRLISNTEANQRALIATQNNVAETLRLLREDVRDNTRRINGRRSSVP